MAARAAALACLAAVAAAAPAPNLYVCQGGQCVVSSRGLPLSECAAVCTPPANYTCQGGQCVVSARGLPEKQCAQVCGGPGPAPAPGGKTIVDLALANPDLFTLVTALQDGGLVGTLSGKGPFTVFAPTNEAFSAATGQGVWPRADKASEVDVLTYHVVAGAIHAKDLKDRETVKTLEGKDLTVRVDGGEVFINSARVVTADVDASNGVVHTLDTVLIPPGPPPGPGPPAGPPSLFFRGFTRGTCADVDAAPRIPAALFEPANAAALQKYIEITVELFQVRPIVLKTCNNVLLNDTVSITN
jgi:uncharacterized surface protein with fasciclin (FAS1) repeats